MEESKRFVKCEHITWKKIGEDSVILLDLNSGKYFSLNETAAVIWQLILSNQSLDDITDEISKRFDSDLAATKEDIQDIVDNFIANSLISENEKASTSKTDNETTLLPDFSRKPYIKPGVQAHAPITQVTAGSSVYYSGSGTHYWYPC